MGSSVSKKIAHRLLVLTAIALVILCVCSFVLLSRIILTKNDSYMRAVLTVYADTVAYNSDLTDVPIDVEHPDISVYFGDYICKWFNVDYAYIYVPDITNGTITYISVAQKEGIREKPIENHMTGQQRKYTLTPGELAVWNGDTVFGKINANNDMGKEFGTVFLTQDTYGNKVLCGVDISYRSVYTQIIGLLLLAAAALIAVFIAVYGAVSYVIRKYVSHPSQVISTAMQAFICDGRHSTVKLDENGAAEYAMIASAFNSMVDDTDRYIENIHLLTRESEHQQTELDIASRIQRGFLPSEQYEDAFCRIDALMKPAKNVGGDLYDYVPLDDGRLLTVIADVSGKGISAAMFMSVTLILIRQYAKMGLQPDEILRQTNDVLSENNALLLFATAFVSIYDSKSRSLIYSNAGHNLPYIVSKTVRPVPGISGAPLGLFANESYERSVIPLKAGEILFMYTDGVNESVNRSKQFYGEEKLEAALAHYDPSGVQSAAAYIGRSVEQYADGAEQYDDITMLALTALDTTELLLKAECSEMAMIKQTILAANIPKSAKMALCLAAEEHFVNICSYAFKGKNKENERIRFTLSVSDKVVMRFEDGGIPFDPLKDIADAENYDVNTQIGGLGRFIAVSCVDKTAYEYRNQKNILTFTKYLQEERT